MKNQIFSGFQSEKITQEIPNLLSKELEYAVDAKMTPKIESHSPLDII